MGEKLGGAVFMLAVLFLAFVAGSLTTLRDAFPSQYIRDANRAGEALMVRRAYGRDPYKSNLWVHPRTPERGVIVHDADRAQPGLTVYSSGHESKAILIDMDGRVIHEWESPFHDIWDESSAVRNPVPEQQIHFRKALASPNGDLLAIYEGVGDTPWGYGMVKLDKDSNVLWKNLEHRFHHDVKVAEDGRIYSLSHDFRHHPVKHNQHLPTPLLEDFLVVLDADGRTVKKISLIEALHRSPFGRELWRVMHFTLWDPLHTNAVEVLNDETAAALKAKVPMAAPGQVLLSFREIDGGTMALLDMDKQEVVWILSGAWRSPHDPDILPNGNILMFDNLGAFGPRGESRIIEVDPATGGIVWSYRGSAEKPLNSQWRAEQQLLPNGNILITESNGARLVEIDRHGDIVWEYINPVRRREDGSAVPIVSWASRLDPNDAEGDFLALLQRRMKTQGDDTTRSTDVVAQRPTR